jgi:pyruvate kinase
MHRQRKIKIVATLGPASSTPEAIRKLYDAGADVFRINMSHGDHDYAKGLHRAIRQVEEEVKRPIAILADLQGPKLRVGVFKKDSKPQLEVGQRFRFDMDPTPGDTRRVQLPHQAVLSVLTPGCTLLINDGKIRARVVESGPDYAETEIVVAGEISNRKGVNVPDVAIPLSALTAKDRADLELMCARGVEWIALSFVQRPEDVKEARELVKGRALINVKIEKPSAVERFAEIVEAADSVMVARGDLGVELPAAAVPPIQNRLIAQSRRAGKPVIVATHMLESMIKMPTPTRAEATDVAHAVYEGADAVMLSAESAVGSFGPEAVAMMDEIAQVVERDPEHHHGLASTRHRALATTPDAITAAAREVAETLEVKLICCFTHSGATAIRMSRERPKTPIMVMTPFLRTARRLVLLWGSHCVVTHDLKRFKEAVISGVEHTRSEGFGDGDDKIVITAGVPFNVAGTTNILRVVQLDENPELSD